jgi:hypothetical protein
VNDYNAGGIVRGPSGVRVTDQGVCPLDGYPIMHFKSDHDFIEGGWEHIIPAAEIRNAPAVLQRIAEAHAFEAVAAAEQITKGTDL